MTIPLNEAILERFRRGFDQAVAAAVPEPTAMTLATVDERGHPCARTVLLKGHDRDGFVFYTNLGSRKGRQLKINPRASLVLWWREIAHQVLIDGPVTQVSDGEADEYFATRPRLSQIGAWASIQSSELDSRDTLEARVARYEQEFADRPVSRPPHWSGFRVRPERVEFWYGHEFRLHERVCYEPVDGRWQERLLYP